MEQDGCLIPQLCLALGTDHSTQFSPQYYTRVEATQAAPGRYVQKEKHQLAQPARLNDYFCKPVMQRCKDGAGAVPCASSPDTSESQEQAVTLEEHMNKKRDILI